MSHQYELDCFVQHLPPISPCGKSKKKGCIKKKNQVKKKSSCEATLSPYQSLTLTCEKFEGKSWITDSCQNPNFESLKPLPSFPSKKWELPLNEIDCDSFLIAILQNAAVKYHNPSGFVSVGLIAKIFEDCGISEFLRQIGIKRNVFRGILSHTFFTVASGRLFITDTLCVEVFLEILAIALQTEIKDSYKITARKLWHIILSSIYFNACHKYLSTLEDSRKASIELSKAFLKRHRKADVFKKLKFIQKIT